MISEDERKKRILMSIPLVVHSCAEQQDAQYSPLPHLKKEPIEEQVTQAEEEKFRRIVHEVVDNAIRRVYREMKVIDFDNYNRRMLSEDIRERLERYIPGIIKRNLNALIRSTKVRPSVKKEMEKIKKLQKEQRKKMADELWSARKRLREALRKEQDAIANVDELVERRYREYYAKRKEETQNRLNDVIEKFRRTRADLDVYCMDWHERFKIRLDVDKGLSDFPIEIPQPFFKGTKKGEGLPDIPGIYFIWENKCVVYVGKSIKLSQRLRTTGHHVLREDHGISFLPFDATMLRWAEYFYIGLLRPSLNGENGLRKRKGERYEESDEEESTSEIRQGQEDPGQENSG